MLLRRRFLEKWKSRSACSISLFFLNSFYENCYYERNFEKKYMTKKRVSFSKVVDWSIHGGARLDQRSPEFQFLAFGCFPFLIFNVYHLDDYQGRGLFGNRGEGKKRRRRARGGGLRFCFFYNFFFFSCQILSSQWWQIAHKKQIKELELLTAG